MQTIPLKCKAVILIVEDEPLLRIAACCFVQEAGFEPVEAANADEAIVLLEDRADIGLVFTDIDMPYGSMNGLKLAQAVADRWPPIKIIVVSGHQTPLQGDMPPGSRFFTKPYQEDEMIAAMNELLAA